MSKRKSFSKEFKVEAVRLLDQGDQTAAEVARDLGVRRNQLYMWREQLRKEGENAFQGSGRKRFDQSDEVTRLRQELERVKMERDILKKAAAYFAKDVT